MTSLKRLLNTKTKDVFKTSSICFCQDKCLLGLFPDIYNSFTCVIKYFENATWNMSTKYQENRKNTKRKMFGLMVVFFIINF